MALPSVHIGKLLATLGYREKGNNANSLDWDIWYGKSPSGPDRSVTIYDTGGLAGNPKWLLDYPSVQVKVRGSQNDYLLSGQKAKDIRNLVVGVESYTASDGDRIVHVNPVGDVIFMEWDDSGRPCWVFNVRMIIEPDPSTPGNREPL